MPKNKNIIFSDPKDPADEVNQFTKTLDFQRSKLLIWQRDRAPGDLFISCFGVSSQWPSYKHRSLKPSGNKSYLIKAENLLLQNIWRLYKKNQNMGKLML